ncbi:MAG TPA: hypothetical protein PLV21_09840 [Cyclobacteriaceae bacterium]|nr:hypothetical protein [Cyclobacteriaceae bacterium]HRJ82174.1 hypothetical protein [Cyclobacteriaceae bacterium]
MLRQRLGQSLPDGRQVWPGGGMCVLGTVLDEHAGPRGPGALDDAPFNPMQVLMTIKKSNISRVAYE